MATATQFCVGLDNHPGTLARLCGALKRARVNIQAISVSDNIENNWVRFVATPAAAARKAIKRAGYDARTQRVLCVRAANKPGELERIASRLAKAKVNINYVYGSTTGDGASTLVLSVSELEKGRRAVGK